MGMRAGEFDIQVTVERKAISQEGDYNSNVIAWVPLAVLPGSPEVAEKFWAQVQDVLPSKSESVTQGLAMAKNQTRVRLRFRSDIDSSMRIVVHYDTDVIYQIIGGPAQIGGRRQFLEIMCAKYSTDGAA